MKTLFYERPSVWKDDGGRIRYRWNMEEVTVGTEDMAYVLWRCDEVVLQEPVTADTVTRAVIRAVWDSDREQKLLNDCNAAQLGVYDDETAQAKIEAYKVFITERDALKAMVDADYAELEKEREQQDNEPAP